MLQQTKVVAVIPYFNTWMKKWPTVQDLAAAELADVERAWAGLGFYGRVRRLHESAKYVVEQLDGKLPSSTVKLEEVTLTCLL